MTPERLAELDAVYTKPLHINFSPEWVKAIGDARREIHNAYPDLRAHIDAQAATIAECEANINLKADFIDATINQLAQADETIARLTGAAKSLLALCEQAGLADDLLAAVFPDSKNRSGQTRDETAKQARRTMNEARAAIAEAAGAA